jgi:hypothetical protein
MYKVILSTPRLKEAHTFPDTPAAMNCAVQLVKRHGLDAEVLIEDAKGIVFGHSEIRRTAETIRP